MSVKIIRQGQDGKGPIVKVEGLVVGEFETYDVSLEYEPRSFAETWGSPSEPDTPPTFWGKPDEARAARDALLEALHAEHVAAGSVGQGALLGGGRYMFEIPVGVTAEGQLQITIGYYRHYNKWLWARGRGIEAGGANCSWKGVYARFEPPAPPLKIIEISETKRKVFGAEGVEEQVDECVVVRNEGDGPVDISGWTIDAGGQGQRFDFPAGTIVEGGNSVTVWTRREDTDSEDAHFSFARKTNVWNNAGDVGRLLDAQGELIHEVSYGDKAG